MIRMTWTCFIYTILTQFVDAPDLEELTASLSFDTPEARISGAVDLYTTKPAGNDKKLYKVLDKQLVSQHNETLVHYTQFPISSSISPPSMPIFSPPSSVRQYSHSMDFHRRVPSSLTSAPPSSIALPSSLSSSPFGPLDQAASRKTFAYLISVLNASHPDHDFSGLQPQDFKREQSSTAVVNSFNNVLFGLGMPVPPTLWEVIDSHIDLKDCAVYSHTPPPSFLADEPGTLWLMMWFFFNKRRKRVAYLSIKANRHHHSPLLQAVSTNSANRPRRRSSIMDEYDEEEEEYDLTYSSASEMYDEVVGDLELE